MRALVAPDAPPVRGVMIAPLRCCFPYLIVVGHSSVFFLRNGTTCPYASGTMLRVLYTENGDGVRDVDAIQTLEEDENERTGSPVGRAGAVARSAEAGGPPPGDS